MERIVYKEAYHQFFTPKKKLHFLYKVSKDFRKLNKLGGQIWSVRQQEHFRENQNRKQTFKDCEFSQWADTTISTLFQPQCHRLGYKK